MKKNKNLIGLSGRSGSGKDLVAQIIEYLFSETTETFENWVAIDFPTYTNWQVKKYADKLKDIVCLLIGCTRAQLEDRVFKEIELGPEWDVYECRVYENGYGYETNSAGFLTYKKATLKEAKEFKKSIEIKSSDKVRLVPIKMTPRKLMQLLGTQCGREIIHPNIWVNSLFSDYKERVYNKCTGHFFDSSVYKHSNCRECDKPFIGWKRQYICNNCIDLNSPYFDKWIISDVRFPINEGGGVSDRGGINIGIKRKFSNRFPEYSELENNDSPYEIPESLSEINLDLYNSLTHESEELMGEFEWCDYVIENNSSIDDLVAAIEEILNKENIL